MNKKTLFLSLMLGLTLAASASIVSAESAPASKITSYSQDSLIKSDGSLWVWSYNQPVPTQISGLSDVQAMFDDGYVLKKDGSVWLWERKGRDLIIELVPVKGLERIIDVFRYGHTTLALNEQGDVFASIPNQEEWDPATFTPVTGIDNVADIQGYYAFEEEQYIFLKKDGSVWKDNNRLQTFEPVQGLNNVVQIAHNMALKGDGTVWTWPATFERKSAKPKAMTPVQLQPLSNIKAIRHNSYSNTAIDGGSRLWFWGATITGVSDGTTRNDNPVPVLLSGIKHVQDAFVVENSLLALTTDGKLFAASTYRTSMPADAEFEQIFSDVQSIRSGPRHIIMQKQDGTLWGWGVNKHAELGYGDYDFSHYKPVPVQNPISVSLNGENVALTSGVITRNGQNFIPLRSVFEKLGAKVTFDQMNKLATVARTEDGKPAITINVSATSGQTRVNDELVTLQNKPFNVNGILYLPLRFISEKLGATVEWISQEDRIAITMK
ncbi:stalk domain-containing protein [Paenibacillus sp. NPDC058177]|uniref:stalk domain-containing protein n=1 Tax=Paenibacillus sp. NPDC058177 TaxID=3346369 RepID=UPI0036DBFFF3